ncbi:MAG: carboxylating nicotinate-nucleotide diphosphorylase [Anaerovorax sp.]|nr:carboxylating nicotinate-nucleotide diphosphorylase [Anaerovorax sp.]
MKNYGFVITQRLNIDPLLLQALQEDITQEDVTTNSVIREACQGEVQLLCKQDGILAGIDVFERVFCLLNSNITVMKNFEDGEIIRKGNQVALITGDVHALLTGERVALNFLQRMSGIATYTNQMVQILNGTKTKLLDTRKTTPNMRIFEKYAVRVGGGYNHRFNLSDGILLKDNHINAAGGVKKAISMAKDYAPFVRKIEIEVENLTMLEEALESGADIIMLDNMSPEDMKIAVSKAKGKAKIECSGNVTLENLKHYADIGVDYISCGALTHSAPMLDFSMKHLHIL